MPARNARKAQIERTIAKQTAQTRQRSNVGWRYFGGREAKKNPQPMFCWSTTKVTVGNETGWASWVKLPEGTHPHAWDDLDESYVVHKTRKAAKARAYSLYCGWRLARGLTNSWRSFA